MIYDGSYHMTIIPPLLFANPTDVGNGVFAPRFPPLTEIAGGPLPGNPSIDT